MISISEAQSIILQQARLFPVETVNLENAYNRVLREDLKNDREQPPFDKSLMDGVAVRFAAWQKGAREFVIEGVIPAGVQPKPLKQDNSCYRIMTGAPIPQGADCVVPFEQIHFDENSARLKDWTILYAKENIRFRGQDGKKGQLLLKAGCLLAPPHIGTAASVGKAKIKVSIQPKVAIVSTGDELVAINKAVKPYQTRLSNSYALASLITRVGGITKIFHFKDNKELLKREIKKLLQSFDVIVLSGGVSMGDFDYVPQALQESGVKRLFHKVAQKPGKPLWFGMGPKGKAVFGLPGNPVSTQMCAYRYVVPYLQKALGLNMLPVHAVLADDFRIKTDLTYFLPVKIEEKQGTRYAYPVDISGSGDFAALAKADGFVELSGELRHFPKGYRALYYSWI